jgi:hypothetical protein
LNLLLRQRKDSFSEPAQHFDLSKPMPIDRDVEQFSENELCGTPDEMRTQHLLIQEERWLTSQMGLLSQGRTLLVFGAERFSHAWLEMVVKKFHRVLIHASREKLLEITDALRASGAGVNEALSLHTAKKVDVLSRLGELNRSRQLPSGWTLEGVEATASAELVKSIQSLYLSSRLTPQPGCFIRGIGVRARTIVLYDEMREVVGSTTVQSLAGVGSSLDGFAMLLSTCLDASIRSRKLSPLLLAASILYGLNEFGARRICDIVETEKLPALLLSKSCALRPHQTEGFIFASFHHSIETAPGSPVDRSSSLNQTRSI